MFYIEQEYESLLAELRADPQRTNKLIYHFSTANQDEILEEITNNEELFNFAQKFAVLTLRDWLAQLENREYRHTVYSGKDLYINEVYQHCRYQWFKLIDAPFPIDDQMVKANLEAVSCLRYSYLSNDDYNISSDYLRALTILTKTSFAECFLRLLIEEQNSK